MVEDNNEAATATATTAAASTAESTGAQIRRSKTANKKDTGVFWDEHLDMYLDGAVNINLYNNVLGFAAGETIAGTIDVEIGKPFEAVDLVVEFKGVERSHITFDDAQTELKPYHREAKELISMKQVIVQFPEGQRLEPGQYSYAFQIYTPTWLPESTLFKTLKNRFTVEYTLRAQFTPRDPQNYVDHPVLAGMHWNVSLFRGSRKIYIYQAPQEIPPKNFKLTMKANVGVRFFGSTESTMTVRFNKNVYYPGEMIDIFVDCDNTKCNKNVRCYKFKLHRLMRSKQWKSGNYDEFVSNLKTIKEKGCKASAHEQKHFQFQIPSMEKDCSDEANAFTNRTSRAIMSKDNRTMSRRLHDNDSDEQEPQYQDLCPSWMGQVFQVQYVLKVFLKHDGFFERGQGQSVNMPIKILATPNSEPSTEPWRVPENWNPYPGTQEPTYIYLQNPDEKPEYMTNYIDRYWAKWEKNIEPVLTEAAEEEKTMLARRNTIKMSADDPDEEVKQASPSPFQQANSPEHDMSQAEAMFSHLTIAPTNDQQSQPTQPAKQQQQQQQQQQPAAEPSFYEQFLKGAAQEPEDIRANPVAENQQHQQYDQNAYYEQQDGAYDQNYDQSQQVYYDENGNAQYFDASQQQQQQQYQDYGQEGYQQQQDQQQYQY